MYRNVLLAFILAPLTELSAVTGRRRGSTCNELRLPQLSQRSLAPLLTILSSQPGIKGNQLPPLR